MRFTTGKDTGAEVIPHRELSVWKVCFGTPDLDTGDGREEVGMLPKFETLEAALQHLLGVQPRETK